MKRFALWFTLAMIGVVWLHSTRSRQFPDDLATLISHDGSRMLISHEPADEQGPLGIRVERHGRNRLVVKGSEVLVERGGKIVHVDEDGVTVSYPNPDDIRVERGGEMVFVDENGVTFSPPNPNRDVDDNDEVADDEMKRRPVEGLPVDVVSGSRVTTVFIEPPHPLKAPKPPEAPKAPRTIAKMVPNGALWEVEGRLSATEERARIDARAKLERELTDRLANDVPRNWKVPAGLINSMIREIKVKPLARDYGTVYAATLFVDFSPQKRAEVVEAYRHEQVVKRLVVIGAVFAFVLVVLAAVSGYIKTDEATKGYYTNTLRVVAASAVCAAGVAIYRLLI